MARFRGEAFFFFSSKKEQQPQFCFGSRRPALVQWVWFWVWVLVPVRLGMRGLGGVLVGGLALGGLGGGLVAWGVVGGGVGVVSGLFGGQRYYAPVASYR